MPPCSVGKRLSKKKVGGEEDGIGKREGKGEREEIKTKQSSGGSQQVIVIIFFFFVFVFILSRPFFLCFDLLKKVKGRK